MHSKPVLIFLSILLSFFAWGIFSFWSKMRETSLNRAIIENKVAELEQQKEKLAVDIDKLKTEEGKEASIREKFGLAKEGEGLVVIVEDKAKPASPSISQGGFFSFIKNMFK